MTVTAISHICTGRLRLLKLLLGLLKVLYEILFIVHVLGAVGLVAAVYALVHRHFVLGSIIAIVGIALVGLGVFLSRNDESHLVPKVTQKVLHSKIEGPIDEKSKELLSTILDDSYDTECIISTLTQDQALVDRIHEFSKVTFHAEVETKTNALGIYRGTYERRGKVVGSIGSEFLTVQLISSTAADSKGITLDAKDLSSGNKLRTQVMYEGYRKLIFRILFAQPLKYGEEFSVGWTFACPGAMRRAGDTDVYALWPLALGTAELEISVLFDWQPQQVVLYEMGSNYVNYSWEQPAFRVKNSRYGYSLRIKNPRAAAYILKYA